MHRKSTVDNRGQLLRGRCRRRRRHRLRLFCPVSVEIVGRHRRFYPQCLKLHSTDIPRCTIILMFPYALSEEGVNGKVVLRVS
jgi:hypothetical protein